MLNFALAMIVPLWVCFYTVQFGRWIHRREAAKAAVSAYALAVVTFVVSGAVLWRMFT